MEKKRSWFNGKEERRVPPGIMSGFDVVAHLQNFDYDFWKDKGKKRGWDNESKEM